MEEQSIDNRKKNYRELLNFAYSKYNFKLVQGPYGYTLYTKEGENGVNNITYYVTIESALLHIVHNYTKRQKSKDDIESLLKSIREEEQVMIKEIVKSIKKEMK